MIKITQLVPMAVALAFVTTTDLNAQATRNNSGKSEPTETGGKISTAASDVMKNNKIIICHIPPGNPENAHSIEVSINATNAHLNGNNGHRDFIGDCFSGCDGFEVIEVNQGLQSNGTAVPASRSDISKVYQYDGINKDNEFFSLGFGGSMVIRFNGGVLNRAGNDIKVFETTFNNNCTNYPEKAEIEVSQDGVNWSSRGIICHDGEIDIAPLDWIQFVRISDRTNPAHFGNQVVDGFDVDGITCLNAGASSARRGEITAERIDLFPNPAVDYFNVVFRGIAANENMNIRIYDITGRVVYQNTVTLAVEGENVMVPISDLRPGVHTLQITGEGVNHIQQVVKQ